MTLINGLDSAFPPNNYLATQAKSQGYEWWGFYIGGVGNTDPLNVWPPIGVLTLEQAGIKPVPICVPSPPALADPVLCANQAFDSCLSLGLNPKVAICYNGEHISVTGPVWIPQPGLKPTSVGPQSAIQWGSGNFFGLSVDYNVSAEDFPMDQGIVCDLEHGAQYTSAWYATFQHQIAARATGEMMASQALPQTAYPIKDVVVSTNGPNPLDVFMLGSDGHVYHKWFRGSWQGPDITDGAV